MVAILAVVAVALPVCAQTVVKCDVPFAFAAGNMSMPAGNYAVSFSAGIFTVALTDADRRTRILTSNPEEVGPGSDLPELVFHRYGDQYFLAEIRTLEGSRDFPASHMEREARGTNSAASAMQAIVVAMREPGYKHSSPWSQTRRPAAFAPRAAVCVFGILFPSVSKP